MRKATITLAVGLVLIGAASAAALTRSPPRVARVGVPTGDVKATALGKILGDISLCQPGETLPAGVSGVRVGMWAFYGAKVHVRVYNGSRVLTEGSRGANWTGTSVTVPVRPVARTTAGVTVCIGIGPNSQPLLLLGSGAPEGAGAGAGDAATLSVSSPTPAAAGKSHQRVGGKIGLEYLRASSGSWWSRVSSVAANMGLGRSYTGTWIAFLIAALMAAVGVLAVRLSLRVLP